VWTAVLTRARRAAANAAEFGRHAPGAPLAATAGDLKGRRMRYKAVCLLVSWLALGAGCIGSIGRDRRSADAPRPGDPGTAGASSAGSGGTTGGAGITGITPEACGPGVAPPLVRARIWRLSARQLANTVKQVFGVDADVSGFPLDGVTNDAITKFDTNADANFVTDEWAAELQTQAGAIAEAYVAKLVAANACVVGASPASTCAPGFWRDLAAKAYRRPLEAPEVDRLVKLWDAARTAYDAKTATRMTVEAMVQAPSFLYRFELGSAPGAKVALTQHELASELAYLIADVPPDDALRMAADRGELTSPAALRPHAQRLIALPSARTKLQTFFATFLGLKELIDGKTKDATKFPTFTRALESSLVADALARVDAIAFDGAGSLDALWTTKLDLGSAFAAVYGSATSRTGLLTHPAVIAALSNDAATSPVHRGLFTYRTMLCGVLPPPPANASSQTDKLTDPTNPNGTQREQWTYFQQSSPACAACHKTFQPLGLTLENYDPIGRFRSDENGKRIDSTVDVVSLDDQIDGHYDDGVALASKVAASDRGRACFGLQLTTFGFGRAVDWTDDGESCRLRALAGRFAGKPLDLRALLLAMTEDDGFFFRAYE
jgi:hypothetical protein